MKDSIINLLMNSISLTFAYLALYIPPATMPITLWPMARAVPGPPLAAKSSAPGLNSPFIGLTSMDTKAPLYVLNAAGPTTTALALYLTKKSL